jgi:hypothetical protein
MHRMLASSMLVACAQVPLAPPPAPPRVVPVPAAPLGPPPPGSSAVLIGANHPAAVDEITRIESPRGASVAHRPVCLATPCTAHLGQGPHRLQFRSLPGNVWAGETEIDVADGPSALQYALGHPSTNTGTYEVGGLLILGGLITAGVAAKTYANEAFGTDRSSAQAAGIIGLAIALLGTLVIAAQPSNPQPGAATYWPLTQ